MRLFNPSIILKQFLGFNIPFLLQAEYAVLQKSRESLLSAPSQRTICHSSQPNAPFGNKSKVCQRSQFLN